MPTAPSVEGYLAGSLLQMVHHLDVGRAAFGAFSCPRGLPLLSRGFPSPLRPLGPGTSPFWVCTVLGLISNPRASKVETLNSSFNAKCITFCAISPIIVGHGLNACAIKCWWTWFDVSNWFLIARQICPC